MPVGYTAYTPKCPHRPTSDWNRRIHRPFPTSREEAEKTARGISARERTKVIVAMGSDDCLCITLPAQDVAELKVMEIG